MDGEIVAKITLLTMSYVSDMLTHGDRVVMVTQEYEQQQQKEILLSILVVYFDQRTFTAYSNIITRPFPEQERRQRCANPNSPALDPVLDQSWQHVMLVSGPWNCSL